MTAQTPHAIVRLAHRLPPWGWLLVALVSLMLAVASAWVLLSQLSDRQKDEWVRRVESVRLFALETYRLTVLQRLPGGDQKPPPNSAVHVAPHGTLHPETRFVWVDQFDDYVASSDEGPPPPTAPPRTLDPAWKPVFSGAFSDT